MHPRGFLHGRRDYLYSTTSPDVCVSAGLDGDEDYGDMFRRSCAPTFNYILFRLVRDRIGELGTYAL